SITTVATGATLAIGPAARLSTGKSVTCADHPPGLHQWLSDFHCAHATCRLLPGPALVGRDRSIRHVAEEPDRIFYEPDRGSGDHCRRRVAVAARAAGTCRTDGSAGDCRRAAQPRAADKLCAA